MTKKRYLLAALVLAAVCILIFPLTANAAPMRDRPRTFTQPDGSIVTCLASGDEYFNYLHDEKGNLIMKGEDGYYVYATLDASRNPVPSANYVNKPGSASQQARGVITPKVTLSDIKLPKAEIQQRADKYSYEGGPARASLAAQAAPKDIANIVMFVTFSDTTTAQTNAFKNSLGFFENSMNRMGGYFDEVSYGQSEVVSTAVMDGAVIAIYKDSHPRSYYQSKYIIDQTTGEVIGINPNGYDPAIDYTDYTDTNGSTYREHVLIQNAVDSLKGKIPVGTQLDYNADSRVDNLTFIVEGAPEGWNDLLWAHRWTLWSHSTTINSKIVLDYNLIPATDYEPGTVAHEMFHSFGAPDLYHYYDDLMPVGVWDIMENNGVDEFQHMTAYMKQRYGYWLDATDVPEITQSGTYTLQPLSSANPATAAYKIRVPGSAAQSFYLEYRNYDVGEYEKYLNWPRFSGSAKGLLVYRVCETVAQGNRNGPPDLLYVLRKDDYNVVIDDQDYETYVASLYATLDNLMTTGARHPGEFIGRDNSYALLKYTTDNPVYPPATTPVDDIRITVMSMDEEELVFEVAFAYDLTLEDTVTGGTAAITDNSDAGAGEYGTTLAGSTVEVSATAANGYTFSQWVSNPAGVAFADAGDASTTFTMPEYNVTITPLFLAETTAGALTITPAALPDGMIDDLYTQTTLTATGNPEIVGGVTFALTGSGSLPSGMNLSSAGVLSGTPTQTGTFSIVVTATETGGTNRTGTRAYALRILPQPVITISPVSLPNGIIDKPYPTRTLAASGGTAPYSFSATGVPEGMNLSPAGVLSGTPTVAGDVALAVTATDAKNKTGTATYNFRIQEATEIEIEPDLPDGKVGERYDAELFLSGGSGNWEEYELTLKSGTLPDGLYFNAGNWSIFGTPTEAGIFPIIVAVNDDLAGYGEQNFDLWIEPTITLAPAALTGGTEGNGLAVTVTATGGIAPYTFEVSAGALPKGLSLDSATGKITGTMTTSGTYAFTVTATDSASELFPSKAEADFTGSKSYTMTVSAKPAAQGTSSSSSAGSPPVVWMPAATTGTGAGAVTGAPTISGIAGDRYDAQGMVLRGFVLDAASYQWQVLEGDKWVDIEGADAAEFLYTGLDPDKEYTVRLAAVNAKGTTYSDPLTFVVNAPGAPQYTDPKPALKATTSYYDINVRTLNIREGMSTSAKKLGTLKRKDMIHGEDMGNGWVKFTWKGKDAYVATGDGKYVTKR